MTNNVAVIADFSSNASNGVLANRQKNLKNSAKSLFSRHLDKARQSEGPQDKDNVKKDKPQDITVDKTEKEKQTTDQNVKQQPDDADSQKNKCEPEKSSVGEDKSAVVSDNSAGSSNVAEPTVDTSFNPAMAAIMLTMTNSTKQGKATTNASAVTAETAETTPKNISPITGPEIANTENGPEKLAVTTDSPTTQGSTTVLNKTANSLPESSSDSAGNANSQNGKNLAQADISGTRLDIKTDGDTGPTADSQTTNTEVKKIINLESQRLQAGKLAAAAADNNDNMNLQVTTADENNLVKTDLIINQTGFEPSKDLQQVAADNSKTNQMPDTKEIMDQIVKKADLMVKLNTSEMKIQLKPEFLGKMLIKVMVDDGVVTARFITDNHNTKQVLEANLNSLRQSLESNGIKVDKTEVSVQLYNDGNFNDDSGSRQQAMWAQQDANGYHTRGNESYEEQTSLSGIDAIMENEYSAEQPAYRVGAEGSVDFVI